MEIRRRACATWWTGWRNVKYGLRSNLKFRYLPERSTVKIESHESTGLAGQQSARPAEEAWTKKDQAGAAPSMRGRKAAWESRASEFRQRLIVWKQTPESVRPSLRALAGELDTTHQMLGYYLDGLDEAEGREMTMRECLDVIITPGLLDQIEELKQEAKRGPLNSYQVKLLNLFAKQGFSGANEILQKCRQMTPQEARQARASERAAMFASVALKNIERIKQEAERGPLPWRDIEILKILARRKCAGAKELLQENAKSALPRPQVPQ